MQNSEEFWIVRPLTLSLAIFFPSRIKGSHQHKVTRQKKATKYVRIPSLEESFMQEAFIPPTNHLETSSKWKKAEVWMNMSALEARSYLHKNRTLSYAAAFKDVQILLLL